MAYMPPPRQLGTFNADPDGLGLSLKRRKKKKKAAPTGVVRKKKKKKKSLIRRIGKGLLRVAPVAAGIFLPGAGAVAVGAASGLIGRGKPKLRNVLRGAAIAGGTKLAVNAIRSGQAGRILVKGKKALGATLRGGGRVVGKLGSGAGQAIENIAKGKIGAKEAAVLGIGGVAVAIAAKKLIKGGGGDVTEEPVVPGDPGHVEPDTPVPTPVDPGDDPPPYPPSGGPVEVEPPPQTGGGTPADAFAEYKAQCESAGGTFSVKDGRPMCKLPNDAPPPTPGGGDGGPVTGPEGPPPPVEPPPVSSGPVPTAGGEVPDTATNALLPGTGDDPYRPFVDSDNDGIPDEEEAAADNKKKTLLIVAGVAAVILLTRKRRKKGA